MNKYIEQDLLNEIKDIDRLIKVIIKKDYCRVGEEKPEEHYQHALSNLYKMQVCLSRLTGIVNSISEEEDYF